MKSAKDMSKRQRINWVYAMDARRMIEYDITDVLIHRYDLPDEWHEIWQDEDRRDPKRQRATMRMDADVVKFFKAMGTGYQERVNRVLRYFMYMRLAGLVEGPDVNDYVLHPEKFPKDGKRPEWGDFEEARHMIKRETAKWKAEGKDHPF